MEETKAKLIERIKRTETVESFRFLPRAKIDFIPGQFLQIIFDSAQPQNKELNKYLSFSSSPTRDYIEVTKRLSESIFSGKLKNIKTGEEIILKAPLGTCVFREEYRKIGFLIGGIGITPVISILEYMVDKNLTTDAVLFYSNRTEEEIAFRKELDYWQGISKNLKFFYTLTECQPRDNRCIFGRIDKDLVKSKAPDFAERIFFIFGPPKMVEAMSTVCLEIGCKRENIKTENFIGY
jgi:ferredoxin-NADP reductase